MKIPFNVDAYTARLIGRENVAKIDGAILELVKNAYDADANICVLYYEKTSNTFYIMDNGYGMDNDAIISNWMTIGYSSKKNDYQLKSGRIQTGAKGIGRFALDRIGDICNMISKTSASSIEWYVDWRDFNIGKKITEVGAEIYDSKRSFDQFISEIKNNNLKDLVKKHFVTSGTIFKLSFLHDEWDETLITQIKNGLSTLIPPEMENIFKIYVFSEESNLEDAQIVVNDGLYSHDYKIDFKVNENGNVNIKIFREEFDFGLKLDEIIQQTAFTNDDKKYFLGKPIEKNIQINEAISGLNIANIGPFYGCFYFSKLSMSKQDKEIYYYKDITGRKSTIGTFGGIKIYRDNFRVRPYGEPNTTAFDWLLLSNRYRKSPAAPSHPTGSWRVNSDQMLGSVHISRLNINLPDQSNREGIVETKEFKLLRDFLIYIIREMERDRQYVARILKKYYDDSHYDELYENEIKNKAKQAKNKKSKNPINNPSTSVDADENSNKPKVDAEIAGRVIDNKNDKIKILEEENHMLRALATTGIVTNTYVHEIKEATSRLRTKIITIRNAIDKNKPIEHISEQINEALSIQNSLNSWFKVTIDMVKKDKRERKFIPLKLSLGNILESWETVLQTKHINIIAEIEDIKFKCFLYDIESIIGNLIANSIKSFENARVNKPEIYIKIKSQENSISLDYSDNGKGLDSKYKQDPNLILEALETSSRNSQGELIGTGMGMWIINKTINEYNGAIDLSGNIIAKDGFFALIKLEGDVKHD